MAANSDICSICLKDVQDKPIYGEFLTSKKPKISVHYYCLLSLEGCPQRGKDNEGILGFLVPDIKKSIKRIEDKSCCYCGQKQAGVKCSEKGCKKTWHYICGRENYCITQFINKFDSLCDQHVQQTNAFKPTRPVGCYVCREEIDPHPASLIFSRCCLNDLKIHEDMKEDELHNYFNCANCMQRYVYNAGYDANCTNCYSPRYEKDPPMTKEEWQNQMREKGIFVPERMATWETDEYFKQQSKQKCGYIDCPNPNVTKNVWTCSACGCLPLHLSCAKVAKPDDYLCSKCFNETFVNLLPSTSGTVSLKSY